jgi:hypothetical protein
MKRLALAIALLVAGAGPALATEVSARAAFKKDYVKYGVCLEQHALALRRIRPLSPHEAVGIVMRRACQEERSEFFLGASDMFGLPIAASDPRIDAYEASLKSLLLKRVAKAQQAR